MKEGVKKKILSLIIVPFCVHIASENKEYLQLIANTISSGHEAPVDSPGNIPFANQHYFHI